MVVDYFSARLLNHAVVDLVINQNDGLIVNGSLQGIQHTDILPSTHVPIQDEKVVLNGLLIQESTEPLPLMKVRIPQTYKHCILGNENRLLNLKQYCSCDSLLNIASSFDLLLQVQLIVFNIGVVEAEPIVLQLRQLEDTGDLALINRDILSGVIRNGEYVLNFTCSLLAGVDLTRSMN